MSSLDQDRQQFLEHARKVYDEKLKDKLEREYFGQVIALDPESGDYVLGKTFGEIDAARQCRFGTKPVYVFRVGGGGAVKIGGTIRERIS